MKFPVGLTPITVPTVKANTSDVNVTTLWVENLVTVAGPASIEGRHAWLRLTTNQAEVLCYELARKLGLQVTVP